MFSLSSLSTALSVRTQFSFPFLCVGNEKVSWNSKAGSEKLCNIQGFSLVGDQEMSKESLKITAFFAVVFLVHVLKYVTFHDVHLNVTQFLCCSPKVFHSVIIRSLWLLVAVTQNEFLNHCHMKETERQKIRSKTESREYYTIVAT